MDRPLVDFGYRVNAAFMGGVCAYYAVRGDAVSTAVWAALFVFAFSLIIPTKR